MHQRIGMKTTYIWKVEKCLYNLSSHNLNFQKKLLSTVTMKKLSDEVP